MGALISTGHVKLTLAGAKLVLEGAEKKAAELGAPMDIAVVDEGGNLLAFSRMDGAKLTSIDIAINKAFTAAGTGRPTHEYTEASSPGGPIFGIHSSNRGRFTIFGGGLPIRLGGQVIGAIGCSSGTVEDDHAVAQAGVDALMRALDGKEEAAAA